MAVQSGQLLWNRRQISIGLITPIDVDTGIRITNRALAPDPDIARQLEIIALPRLDVWDRVTFQEPFFDPTTGTVHVLMARAGGVDSVTFNVLFVMPHTLAGPMTADTYLP